MTIGTEARKVVRLPPEDMQLARSFSCLMGLFAEFGVEVRWGDLIDELTRRHLPKPPLLSAG